MENALLIHVFEPRGGQHPPRRERRTGRNRDLDTVTFTAGKGGLSADHRGVPGGREAPHGPVDRDHADRVQQRAHRPRSAALLDRITIDYYGTPTQLKNMATIGVPEPRMITVQPFDPSQIKAIEKAVQESDLGLTRRTTASSSGSRSRS